MRAQREAVLFVDLSTDTVERRPVPEAWRRRYLGGKGLGARYLYEEVPAAADPRGPENVLGFMLGPVSGYLPGETRYAAVTKSPLTGTFLDSYSGGAFADRLAGSLSDCLGLLITGVASSPVRIELDSGECSIEPAQTWGCDTVETDDAFPDSAVACIGPAGEREVAYATIASDGGDHHAGRGGAGAVMGTKRLKAVVVHDREPAIPDDLETLHENYAAAYERDDTGTWLAAGGTLETVDYANEVGILSAEGWQQTEFDGTDDIGIEAATARANGREQSGPVPGDFRIETETGEVVPRGAAPITLGAGLGIDEFDAVVDLAGFCDRLGLDVISAGNAVAWAIRAGGAGVADCDLEFGDPAGARQLLSAIARRDEGPEWVASGLPDALANGVDAATRQFGGDELIPTVKSMALPGFDPRQTVGMALAFATSDRGACHRRARPLEREPLAGAAWSMQDRVRAVVGEQNARSVLWSLVVDDFVGETLWDDLGAEWLAALEYDHDVETLVDTGERIWNLVRLFNAREGFDREDDALPSMFHSPVGDSDAVIDPDAFDEMLDLYYAARGWGPNGLPTPETVARLDLTATVDAETPLGAPWTGETDSSDPSENE